MTGYAQIAAAKQTLWELIKRQCGTLSVCLKKAQDFPPPQNAVRFNSNVSFTKVKTDSLHSSSFFLFMI